MDQPAHAAEPTRLCVRGDLLDAEVTALGGSLACTPAPPPRSPVEATRVRVDLVLPGADQPLARVKLSARVPTGGQSSNRRIPARQPVDAPRPRGGVDAIVEVAGSVVRRVVGIASPAVAEVSRTGLPEPVAAVVRPVADPIVDVLPPVLTPVLAPVLDVAQPILGPPAAPSTPPADPVEIAPTPVGGASAVGTPGALTRSAAPLFAVAPGDPSPAPASTTAPHRKPWADAGRALVPPGDPRNPPGSAPGAPASTAGSGSAAVGTGDPADATVRSWAPDLKRSGHHVRGCDTLAGRSPQPDTRPA
ncbi:hypothetical protein [Micromonospora thermarum]|uniref:hypothetical protein n=1 Tax=Micromonospora thermarum TaxID=2720024 RepID=UPI00197C63A9|nr:hypothetical protein [Micromonospora thermarum]